MGMLADRRDELGQARTQVAGRLHRLLLELLPGGAKKFGSARQARALIATDGPRDLAGKTRRRLAVELAGELEAIGGSPDSNGHADRHPGADPIPSTHGHYHEGGDARRPQPAVCRRRRESGYRPIGRDRHPEHANLHHAGQLASVLVLLGLPRRHVKLRGR